MEKWASILTLVLCLILVGPAMLRLNQGKMLPRLALWVGLLLFLVWIYKTFGPF